MLSLFYHTALEAAGIVCVLTKYLFIYGLEDNTPTTLIYIYIQEPANRFMKYKEFYYFNPLSSDIASKTKRTTGRGFFDGPLPLVFLFFG